MDYKIFTPLIPFAIGIIFKTLLDLNLGIWIIKCFYWIPPRNIFRKNPNVVKGVWGQHWENSKSSNYSLEEVRKSKLKIKQFGNYIYGEFRVQNDELYYIFAKIIGKNIIGQWANKNDKLGYFGALEMVIVDSNTIDGLWLGHSHKNPNIIYSDKWTWKKLNI